MKKKVLIIAALLMSNAAIATEGSESSYSKNYNKCMDGATATPDIIVCIDAEFKLQDDELNFVYKQVTKDMSADRKSLLLKAQKAWISYKESNCKFYFDPDGGSMSQIDANQCLLDMTAGRLKELKSFLAK